MNELGNRGVEDLLLEVVAEFKDFPEAILAVFLKAAVQTYIVQLLRHSLNFISCIDRRAGAAALKDICRGIPGPGRNRADGVQWPGRGARNTLPSARAGGAPGARLCRFTRFPPRSAGFCEPRMRSRL